MPTRDVIVQRGVETVIGVAVGLAVAWLTRRPAAGRAQANSVSPQ
jgi:hypothetical protein